jgi:23S rRNA pseudouridine1911/1915/1917 synthase
MSAPLEVLFCDNHLLVVVKPAGLPTVPDSSGDESLLERAKQWVQQRFAKPGAVFLGVVQRLDRPVAGAIVFARTSKAAARLSAQLREHRLDKLYWGVGQGAPAGAGGELEEWLVKDELKNRVRSAAQGEPGARAARTRWRVLEQHGGLTLYELRPLTGRPHQLRSCARALGTPLCGDTKYGASAPAGDGSIALRAVELTLAHPTQGGALQFRSPPEPRGVWRFRAVSEAWEARDPRA